MRTNMLTRTRHFVLQHNVVILLLLLDCLLCPDHRRSVPEWAEHPQYRAPDIVRHSAGAGAHHCPDRRRHRPFGRLGVEHGRGADDGAAALRHVAGRADRPAFWRRRRPGERPAGDQGQDRAVYCHARHHDGGARHHADLHAPAADSRAPMPPLPSGGPGRSAPSPSRS